MPRTSLLALIAILALGTALRVTALTQAPPGLHQDEAANAWNAWCLLHTGTDEHGVAWPVFHMRAFGGHRSTLGAYYLVPFLAAGGLSVGVVRLAFALAGVASLLLTFLIGRRLGGERVGLAAVAVLAINPWHLMQSRWAHEAALVPLLVSAPLWLWLRCGLPPGSDAPRWGRALLAGLVAGVCCYGYPAVRPFFLVFFACLILFQPGAWRAGLGNPAFRRAALAFGVGLAVVAGPLAAAHLLDPDINQRLAATASWEAGAPLVDNLSRVLGRVPGHFGPAFLFLEGDRYELQSPPGSGQFHLYAAPWMLVGAGLILVRWRSKGWARFLAAWLVTYPAGDLLTRHADVDGVTSMHALRSLPGLPGLALVTGVGLVAGYAWLLRRSRTTLVLGSVLFGMLVLGTQARFLATYFGSYPERRSTYHAFHVDLVDASRELGRAPDPPHAVFCTAIQMIQPYVITLVARAYDPERWFADVKEMDRSGEWDEVRRYGNMHFLFDTRAGRRVSQMRGDDRTEVAEFWLRTGQSGLPAPRRRILYSNGLPALLIIRTEL